MDSNNYFPSFQFLLPISNLPEPISYQFIDHLFIHLVI